MPRKKIDTVEKPAQPSSLNKDTQKHTAYSLQKAINRVFNDFLMNFDMTALSVFEENTCFIPHMNMREYDDEIKVTAELPGMDDKDIEIVFNDNRLIIKGDKKQPQADPNEEIHFIERSYGCFERQISIPTMVDPDNAHATFNKGVLSISMPKINPEKRLKKKIRIKK